MPCASCGKSNKRPKLLKCLHSVCVGCLEKHLTSLNEVDCPKCGKLTPPRKAGNSQSQCLPDSYDHGRDIRERTQAEQVQQLCDECGVDEAAESRCLDCKATLCELHAKGHVKSRNTLNHRLELISRITAKPSSGGAAQMNEERSMMRCITHPSCTLKSFCVTCKELMCEKCLSGRQVCNKGEATHTLLSVGQAAEKMRGSVKEILTGSTVGNQESLITQAIKDMDTAISQLHDRTEAVSEEVVEYFASVSKLLKAREAAILEKLDRLRSAKLLPLEQQKQRLEKSVSSHEIVSLLLTSCHDDCDLIRMAGWLEEAASEGNKSARSDLKPRVLSNLVFRDENANILNAAIARVGDVIDEPDIDPSQSSVECPSYICLGEELVMTVTAVTNSGQAVISDDDIMTSLQVKVTSSDNEAVSCVTSPGDGGGKFIAKHTPKKSEQHRVTVKFGESHFTGSPADVMVVEGKFDPSPDRRYTSIQLSNNNMTARSSEGRFRSVCGSDVYRSGFVSIRIRLDHILNGRVFLFMCNSPTPVLDDWKQRDNTAFGWYGSDASPRNYRGTSLGQQWQDGDIIHLSLDCDRHTLTGRHERTGTTETLSGVTGDLYLLVVLTDADNQVTVL